MSDAEGLPSGIMLLISDVTERTDLAQELEQEHRLLSTILENVDVSVVACDRHAKLTIINSSAIDSFGVQEHVPSEQWATECRVYNGEGSRLLALEEIPLYRALRGERVKNAEIVVQPNHKPRRTQLV